jgi:shikimate kinase
VSDERHSEAHPGVGSARNLVLIGPMGAGKSSVARLLAVWTGWRAVDTDAWVRRDQGRSIPEIFAERGEAFFREREAAALEALEGRSRFVVATGGGIVVRPDNRERLRALGCVIWLSASPDVLFERVSRNQRRPLLQTADPRSTLVELLQVREPLYRSCAHFAVDTSGKSHAEVAREVLAGVGRFFPGPA